MKQIFNKFEEIILFFYIIYGYLWGYLQWNACLILFNNNRYEALL